MTAWSRCSFVTVMPDGAAAATMSTTVAVLAALGMTKTSSAEKR